MIKVVSFTICPFVQRITAALEARNIPYEVEYISLKDKPGWFLDISPTGQVPVLVTRQGVPLFESDAIAEYIDEVYGPLEPDLTAEQRASDRAWSYQASKHYLSQCSAMRSPDAETLAQRAADLGKAFARVEKKLGVRPFFNGDTPGNVDIAWLPILHRASIVEIHTGYDFVASYPKLKRWQQHLMATGLAEKSVAEGFEEAFTKFYLSGETTLGRGLDDTGARRQSCCADSCCG